MRRHRKRIAFDGRYDRRLPGRRQLGFDEALTAELLRALAPRRRMRRALANLVRLAWHFRAQLAPLATLIGLWIAGATVHGAAHGARSVIVCALLALAGLWLFSRRWLDRTIERVYATGCLIAGAGWLYAAAVRGVGRPMPAILWGIGAPLALPWWHHYRLRGKPVVPPTVVETWDASVGAQGCCLPGSRLTDVEEIDNGWRAVINLQPGKASTEDAIGRTALVTSAYQRTTGSVMIEPTADGNAAQAQLLVLDRNPLHTVRPWTGPTLDAETGICQIGMYPDGGIAYLRFWQPKSGAVHTLTSGSTGVGKSRFLEMVLSEAAHSGLIVIWLIDPQQGQSLPDWLDHVDWAALGVDQALATLRAARRVMLARSAHLSRVEWTDPQGRRRRGKDYFEPSAEMPLLLLVIDEAHELLTNSPEAVRILESIAKMGRKTGIGVVLATQLPSIAELGGSMTIRSMIASGNVIVFRTGDRVTSGMAFNGAAPGDPSKLPREFTDGSSAAGLAYTLGPGSRVAVMRSLLVEDPFHWARTAPATALDVLSVEAAGEDYQRRHDQPVVIDAGEQYADESAEDTPRVAEIVLQVIRGAGRIVSTREILAASGGRSLRAISLALAEHVKAGRVVKYGHGRYGVPGLGEDERQAS